MATPRDDRATHFSASSPLDIINLCTPSPQTTPTRPHPLQNHDWVTPTNAPRLSPLPLPPFLVGGASTHALDHTPLPFLVTSDPPPLPMRPSYNVASSNDSSHRNISSSAPHQVQSTAQGVAPSITPLNALPGNCPFQAIPPLLPSGPSHALGYLQQPIPSFSSSSSLSSDHTH